MNAESSRSHLIFTMELENSATNTAKKGAVASAVSVTVSLKKLILSSCPFKCFVSLIDAWFLIRPLSASRYRRRPS